MFEVIIVRQDRNAFYNWDNTVGIYISGRSRTEILLKHVKDSKEPIDYLIGSYKNVENAKAAFEKLIENILKEIPLVVVRTDEEIEKSIHREDRNSN
jgi:hypothetical protein|nr:MAG TPA: hypothetical protein [Caudoviricetes sp.]